MNIVCLAWGSLFWRPGALPVSDTWHADGPSLPIEFARVGDKGELATVLCPGAPLSRVRWTRLGEGNLATALRLLREREEIPPERIGGAGVAVVGELPAAPPAAAEILRWAAGKEGVDAVIWTSLPPRFDEVEGRAPSPGEAVDYLRRLTGRPREHAEAYVRLVPAEIRTPNRAALEKAIRR